MSVRLFGCKKYRKLSAEASDRELTVRESRFLDKHSAVCPRCVDEVAESSMALNMLRAATLDATAEPAFEQKVLRQYRVNNVRASIRYWSPALAGAGIACIALFAAFALLGRPSMLQRDHKVLDQTRRVDIPNRALPSLVLPDNARFIQ